MINFADGKYRGSKASSQMVKCTNYRNDYSVIVSGVDTIKRISSQWK